MFTRYDDNLARHIYLLQDINEALFYKLVTDHARGDAPIVCTRRSASCPSTPRSGRDQGNRPGWLRVRPGGLNATVEVGRNQTVTPLSVRKN